MPTYFCKECDGNGYQQDGWDESDDAEERRRRARARREQRRARKARKNLVMYKLAGRRPWDCGPFGDVLDSLTRQLGDGQRLRERSGFLDMSRLAEGMKRHPYDEFEEWLQESWGDLTPDEIAERIGRQP